MDSAYLRVRIAVSIALVVGAFAPRLARADDACIADDVRAKWSACPKLETAAKPPADLADRVAAAKSLAAKNDWAASAAAYDAVFAADPTGPLAATAARGSAEAWYALYEEAHANGGRKGLGMPPAEKIAPDALAPSELDDTQAAMTASFARYVCVAKPGATASPAERTFHAEVLYARARVFFEARHWEEAALGFREVAVDHADEDVGIFATQLYIESLDALGTEMAAPRTACFDDIAADVPKLIALDCSGAKASQNQQPCDVLGRIERDVARLSAEKLFEKARGVGSAREAAKLYREAGKAYLDLWDKYGREPCEKAGKASPEMTGGCARNDEVLENAANAFEAAHDVDEAIAVREIMLDPKYHLAETPLAKQASFRIAMTYAALLKVDEAAAWFERYARENPGPAEATGSLSPSAADALSNASRLRLALGDFEAARADADLLDKRYAGPQATENRFWLCHQLVEHEDWALGEKTLKAAMPDVDARAPKDLAILAHADLARASAKMGHLDAAKREYDRVRSSRSLVESIEADRARSLGRLSDVDVPADSPLFDALGEADFFFADAARDGAGNPAFPAYAGPTDLDSVRTFVDKEATRFIDDRTKALAPAVAAYRAIADLPPERAGIWSVRAEVRAFDVAARTYAGVVAAPFPAAWHPTGPSGTAGLDWADVRSAYRERLIDRAAPLETTLRQEARRCLAIGTALHAHPSETRTCEAWLARHDPTFVPITEPIDAPVRSGLPLRTPFLERDAEPMIED